MTVTPPPEQVEVFPVLDTLRAVAATAVVVTHVAFQTGNYHDSLRGHALARLDIGVAIFFVLSGFLLSRPFLSRARAGLPAPSVRRYLRRRTLRIMPVYVVAVTAALLLLPDNRDATVAEWVRNLTLTDIYANGGLPAGLSQMWSLSAEVAFYLGLPVLMLTTRSTRLRGREMSWALVAVVLGLGLSVGWIVFALDNETLPVAGLQWLPTFAVWFAVGMVLAATEVNVRAAAVPHRSADMLRRLGRLPGTCYTMALALFLVACTPLAGPILLFLPSVQQATTKTVLYAAIAGLMILPGVFAAPTGLFSRVLSWRPLRHLGHISYSLFCIHLVVLALVIRGLDVRLFSGDGVRVLVLTLLFSLLASEALYWGVERPFMRLSGRSGSSRDAARSRESANVAQS